MTSCAIVLLIVVLFGSSCVAVFLHNPRGSNNRLDERGMRQNDQRLFNSQNNAAGGYGINALDEQMVHFEGSELTVSFSTQPTLCTGEDNSCTAVLQMLCGSTDAPAASLIRDGLTTDEITPENYEAEPPRNSRKKKKKKKKVDESTKKHRFGLHESLEFFRRCEARDRNKGQPQRRERAVHAPEQRRHALRLRVPGGARLLPVLAPFAVVRRCSLDSKHFRMSSSRAGFAKRGADRTLRAGERRRVFGRLGVGLEDEQQGGLRRWWFQVDGHARQRSGRTVLWRLASQRRL
jgi:hypothetical protein